MYDELVKRMRKCATEAGACKTCELDSNPSCTDVLMEQAADAIEELVGFVQEAERDRDEYRERLDKANDAIEELSAAEKKYLANISALETENQHLKRERYWIPVTERLPKEGEFVLVHGNLYPNKHDGGVIAVSKRMDWNYWQGFGREIDITHWMPLPSTEGLDEA